MRSPIDLARKAFKNREVTRLVAASALSKRFRREPSPPRLQLDPAVPSELERIKAAFDERGSDKTSTMSYTSIYASIVRNLEPNPRILEIGIGTNFDDIESSMGRSGIPGASLRAFRDLRPDATVFGADVDRRILFEEPGITTHWVDQLEPSSLVALRDKLGGEFDLVIDDGLHTRPANRNTFRALFSAVKPGGYFILEDVVASSIPFWGYILDRERLHGAVFDMRRESNRFDNVAVVIKAARRSLGSPGISATPR
jgi:hypothetical protein